MNSKTIWFIKCRIPAILTELLEIILFIPKHKRTSWNTRIYDGLTKNDFQRGNFIEFLHKADIIKQLEWKDDDDGRGYFIGYKDDE